MTVPGAGHGPNHVGGENLPGLTGSTEPGRFYDRVPEVVVVLSGDFSTTETHPQAHGVLRARLSRSAPCCMATAHPNAADAELKTTMSPSPGFFTSVPPDSAIACRRVEKWTGAAELGGTLAISEGGGYMPPHGKTFKIVTYGSETGEFSTLDGSPAYTVTYESTDAKVVFS